MVKCCRFSMALSSVELFLVFTHSFSRHGGKFSKYQNSSTYTYKQTDIYIPYAYMTFTAYGYTYLDSIHITQSI